MVVKVNKNNGTAHLSDCIGAQSLKEENTITLRNPKQARKLGYKFCKSCQSRLDNEQIEDDTFFKRFVNLIFRR
jgi:methylphosphotriester-DNA--protein-cysteine methyltransferase